MDGLKPCPFCGEIPDKNDEWTFQSNQGDKWGFVVCCCQGPEVRTGYQPVEKWRNEAIKAWNERREMMEWQPIETAPNETVLIYCPDLGTELKIRMGHRCTVFDKPAWTYHGASAAYYFVEPTHWMPLPDPPKDAG